MGMMLWLYLIWQCVASCMATGQSFSTAMEMYKQICMMNQPACRNTTHLVQYSTVQPFVSKGPVSNSNCCGFCECKDDCTERGSCCLGYRYTSKQIKRAMDSSRFMCETPQFLTLPEETFFQKAPGVEQVWLVNKCATNQSSYTNERVTRLCEDPEFDTSLKTIVPVSGEYYTYRNIYCAYCSGATRPWVNWKLNIFCTDFVSLTDEDILSTVRQKKCNIFYERLQNADIQTCRTTSFSISRCNETGLWPKFDRNIDSACRSFTDPFNSTYKNYFCYVCNTNESIPLDMWQCNVPREDLPITTPPYSLSYDMEMINNANNEKFLGCDTTKQFPDLKLMKCRNLFCQRDRPYEPVLRNCKRDRNFGKDYCFSIFIELTPHEEYILRKTQLKQDTNLLRIKSFITDFLKDKRDAVKEIRLYTKFRGSSRNSIVEYLVAQVIVDVEKTSDVLNYFMINMKAGTDIKGLSEETSVFQTRLAVYNITSNVNGKREIFAPRYNSPDGDALHELDLSASEVFRKFVAKDADNSCLTKESRPFRKTDILPFIKVALNEFTINIENNFLILHEAYLKKVFTSFEYEVHHDEIHLCLEDYIFIYDVMPKDRSYKEISRTSFLTKAYVTSIGCAFIASLYNSLIF